MNHRSAIACLAASLLIPVSAGANPEPTAYDTRSIGMGLTGVTFLDRPAALVLNPANLDGIDKIGFTVNFTGLFVNQRAPVQGPNTRVDSGVGFGPVPAGFIAGRIAPRVVLGGGIYIETGYGSSFDDVTCLDGDPVVDGVPDTDPTSCTNGNPEPGPQDLDVTFFVGEFAAGFSVLAHERFQLGVALRLPFSKQVADLYQNIGAATPILPSPTYARVKNDLGGVGIPSARFGFTIKPHRKVRISAMYRVASKIKLTGTTETEFLPGVPVTLNAEADWFIPHAIAFGVSYQANSHLLLAFEGRVQFHGAKKTGNQNQTVTAQDPNGVFPDTRIVVPFGWENAWSAKIGFEYRFKKDVLALRLGANVAKGATSAPWAQYFTPPPAPAGLQTVTAGLGFYWDDRNDPSIKDKYRLDLGGLFAFTKDTIGNEYIGQQALVPGGDPNNPVDNPRICTEDQVVRTGCPGEYRVFSYWASVSFTLQY